jgi:hypothetical protein
VAVDINVYADTKAISKKLSDLAYRQMPFATAQALTAVAREVQGQEKQALPSIFDKPTPFTENSIGVIPARKDNPVAQVFIKDIAAAYLAPYEFGGKNKLNSQALLKPVAQGVNQYGNLPRTKLSQLKGQAAKGKKGIFVGKVKTKSGQEVDGVWQRVPAAKGQSSHLKLLIKFTDAHEARQHMDWFKRADQIVRRTYQREFGKALAKAMATAE